MSVTYTSHLQLTSDQRQSNQIYGIFQAEKRTLVIDENNLTFSYTYDYYYQKEISYEIVKQIKNITTINHNATKEGDLFVVVFTDGKQDAQDQHNKTNLFEEGKFSGRITFVKDGVNIKIQSVDLKPDNLSRKANIIRVGQLFTRQQIKSLQPPKIEETQKIIEKEETNNKIQAIVQDKTINGGTTNKIQPQEASSKSIQEPIVMGKSQKEIQEQVKTFLKNISSNLSGQQSQQYVRYSIQSKKKIDEQNFKQWKNQQQKQKNTNKNIKNTEKQETKQKKLKIQKKQPQQQKQKIQPIAQIKKIQLTPLQKINLFFETQKSSENKQIKSSQIQLINKLITITIPITKNHVLKYLQTQSNPSFEGFKAWIKIQEQNDIKFIIQEYKKGKNYQNFVVNLQRVRSVVELCNEEKKSLKVGLGVGENKGKTSIKCGLFLSENIQQHCVLVIDIKTKKKSQLKAILETDLKTIYKVSQPNLLKICKINFIQNQKSLKIEINLNNLQKQLFANLITTMKNKMSQYNNAANFKFEAQLMIKNSIRSNDDSLHNKKWVKWINEGFSSSYYVQGNSSIIKLFVSPFTDIFPSLKIVRSGQINLKLKNIDNIDKFYDKLGINQLCQELPNLSTFSQQLIGQHINDDRMPIAQFFIKKYLIFAASMPNQKIQLDLHVNIHHLNLSLNIVGDACKELSTIINKLFIQNFN